MGRSRRVDRDTKLGARTSRRRWAAVLVVVVAALLSACSGPSIGGPKSVSDRRPLPTVTGVTPNSGPTTGGTIVTITGTGFTGTTKVSFGSVAASSIHVVSGTEVAAIAPAQSTSIQTVSVTTPVGTSALAPANDQFRYDAPTPVVASIAPGSGPDAGGTLVTITGSGFIGAGKVRFGTAVAAQFTVVSDTVVTAMTPAQAPGPHPVYVTTAGGTNTAGGAGSEYRALPPVPATAAVTPASGPTTGGTTVTITGTGFSGATKVAFGAIAATGFTVVSNTVITAVTPAEVGGTRPVYVITPGGRSSAGTFTFVASPPSVTAVTPSSGPKAGGTTVTITGTGFGGATKVAFGAVLATNFTVVSATEITAVTPGQGAGTRPVLVTTALEGTSSSGGPPDTFTYIASTPSVASVSPQSGPVSGGTTVTITGTGFTGTTKVAFGPVAAGSFTLVSDSEITAVTPAQPAGARGVYVTTVGGGTSPPAGPSDEFTYVS
jgi:hypothetical protein